MMQDVTPEDAIAAPDEYTEAIPPPVLHDGGSPSKNPLPPPDMFQDDSKSDATGTQNFAPQLEQIVLLRCF